MPPVRRQSLVAGVVLTAALVTLVALPGAVGSQTPSTARLLTAEAFQAVRLPASNDGSPQAIRLLDAGYESAGHLDETASLIEPGNYSPPAKRSRVSQPVPKSITVAPPEPPYKRVVRGLASWYGFGTTAMRLPRGTHVKICGARSCVTTVVRDYGPARYLSARVVDMTPWDFVRVTGKRLGAGLALVKVYIY